MRGFRVFDDLFWKYMLAYKKRTIFTVLGITLSVILFFGSGTVYTSIYQAFYESSRIEYGDYDAEGTVNPDQYQKLRQLDYVEELLLNWTEQWFIEVEEDTDIYASLCFMENFDNSIYQFDLVEGRYPEKPDELLLDTYQADYYGVGVGDTLNISCYEYWYGNQRIGDGRQAFEYVQNHSEYMENGELTEDSIQIEDLECRTITVEYQIAGIYETNQVNGGFFIEFTPIYGLIDRTQDYREMNVCVRFRNHKNHIRQLMEEEGIFLFENEMVTMYLTGYSNVSMDPLLRYILFMIAFIILFWIAVLIIRNVFVISMAERARDYGILRCMGTSQYRLRRLLLKEGLAMAGMGCVLGIGIASLVIQFGKYIGGFKQILQFWGIWEVFYLQISWWMIFGSIAFTFLAVLFSLLEPARQIGLIAPVDAVIGRATIKKERIKRRSGRLVRAVFGVEGEYAYKNLMRNKGKFITSIVGIVISVTGLMISFSLIHIVNDSLDGDEMYYMMGNLSEDILYDAYASFTSGKGKTNEDIMQFEQDLLALKSVEAVRSCYTTYMPSDGKHYGLATDHSGKSYTDYRANGFDESQIAELEPYILEGSLDYTALEQGGVILCRNKKTMVNFGGEWRESKSQVTDLTVGDTLWIPKESLSYDYGEDVVGIFHDDGTVDEDKMIACPVIAVVDYNPCSIWANTPQVIFSRGYYQSHVIPTDEDAAGLYEILVKCSEDYDTEEIFEFQKENKDYYFTDGGIHEIKDSMQGYRQLILLVVTLFAGIGAFNIFNTLSSNIALRKRELQVMSAVGMSHRQTLKMLGLEGGLAAIFGSLLGIGIGIGVGYLLTRFYQEISYGMKYHLPWVGVLLSILLAVVITGISIIIARRDLQTWEE